MKKLRRRKHPVRTQNNPLAELGQVLRNSVNEKKETKRSNFLDGISSSMTAELRRDNQDYR